MTLSAPLHPRLYAALFAMTVGATALTAQGNPLSGRWDIEYERGRRIENDEVTVIRGKALLTLEIRGDSLVGTLEPVAQPGLPTTPTQRFAAKSMASGTVFVVTSEAKLNMNGEIETRVVTTTWTLEAKGDALSGTAQRVIAGMDAMTSEPTPVSGTRAK